MHDDQIDRLYKLLVIHEKLMGHPKLANVRTDVQKELDTLNEPEEKDDGPAPPLFPKDSGVTQKDTERRV